MLNQESAKRVLEYSGRIGIESNILTMIAGKPLASRWKHGEHQVDNLKGSLIESLKDASKSMEMLQGILERCAQFVDEDTDVSSVSELCEDDKLTNRFLNLCEDIKNKMRQHGLNHHNNNDGDSEICSEEEDDDCMSRNSLLSPVRRRTTTGSSTSSCRKSTTRKLVRLNLQAPSFMDRQVSNRSTISFVSEASSITDNDDDLDSEDDTKKESEDEEVEVVDQRTNWPYPDVPPGASTSHADILKNSKRKRRRKRKQKAIEIIRTQMVQGNVLKCRYEVISKIEYRCDDFEESRVVVARDLKDEMHSRSVILKFIMGVDRGKKERDCQELLGNYALPILDSFDLFGVVFVIVMAHASSGASVATVCDKENRNSIDSLTVRSYAKQILMCVNEMHNLCLVHCDIRPEHFLFYCGRIRLIGMCVVVIVFLFCFLSLSLSLSSHTHILTHTSSHAHPHTQISEARIERTMM